MGSSESPLPDLASDAVSYLEAKRNFSFLGLIGEGSFGVVIQGWDPLRKYPLAVKVVVEPEEGEMKLWKKLNHPNLVPLLEIIELKTIFTMFIMPLQCRPLMEHVKREDFRKDPGSLKKVKSWLIDLLSATSYLHGAGFCHLDLKPDNMLLSFNGRAMITDYSFLAYATTVTAKRQIGLPLIYQPPEVACQYPAIQVSGCKVDLWSLGISSLEIATQEAFRTNLPKYLSWPIDVRAVMQKVQRSDYLGVLLRDAHPAVVITDEDISQCWDFLVQFLTEDPNNRVPAFTAINHQFLNCMFFKGLPHDDRRTDGSFYFPDRGDKVTEQDTDSFSLCPSSLSDSPPSVHAFMKDESSGIPFTNPNESNQDKEILGCATSPSSSPGTPVHKGNISYSEKLFLSPPKTVSSPFCCQNEKVNRHPSDKAGLPFRKKPQRKDHRFQDPSQTSFRSSRPASGGQIDIAQWTWKHSKTSLESTISSSSPGNNDAEDDDEEEDDEDDLDTEEDPNIPGALINEPHKARSNHSVGSAFQMSSEESNSRSFNSVRRNPNVALESESTASGYSNSATYRSDFKNKYDYESTPFAQPKQESYKNESKKIIDRIMVRFQKARRSGSSFDSPPID